MKPSVAPLREAELPAREKAFWRLTGPGAVLVGLSIGAGEIVIWPRIAAQYGASMVWAAALGVFLQLWVNLEIGRWTIATGESAYTGYARLWRGSAIAFIALNVAGWLLPGWARTSGLALKALVLGPAHPSPDWLWTAITFAGVAAVLFGPKRIYRSVERSIGLLVVFITLALVFIALRVGTLANLGELTGGLLNVGFVERDFPVQTLFSALVFAGAGGTANLFYAFYLRDKQIGMAARVPILLNPLRAREQAAVQTGFVFPETPENRRRFRDWFRFVALDQTLYFWLLNSFTILLFIFGALAVLHPRGIVPAEGTLIWDEAAILAETLGGFGRTLFLLVGVATLFSTQVALVDGFSRSVADILATRYARDPRAAVPAWYLRAALFLIVAGTALTAIMEYRGMTELGFLFNAAYMGGFAMALYTPLTLWMNLRHLPRSARPGPLNVAMMLVASAVYVGFALTCIATEIDQRLLR
jgi:hypothetical protein